MLWDITRAATCSDDFSIFAMFAAIPVLFSRGTNDDTADELGEQHHISTNIPQASSGNHNSTDRMSCPRHTETRPVAIRRRVFFSIDLRNVCLPRFRPGRAACAPCEQSHSDNARWPTLRSLLLVSISWQVPGWSPWCEPSGTQPNCRWISLRKKWNNFSVWRQDFNAVIEGFLNFCIEAVASVRNQITNVYSDVASNVCARCITPHVVIKCFIDAAFHTFISRCACKIWPY